MDFTSFAHLVSFFCRERSLSSSDYECVNSLDDGYRILDLPLATEMSLHYYHYGYYQNSMK